MQFLVISLCCALCLSIPVHGESENHVMRERFPFMAYVYYSDNKVVDETGNRFIHSGVLFKPDWLITSFIKEDENKLAFPTKTLLARLGAISIDANFTLNEDEDEQEREIIQIVRPVILDKAPWWHSDISLLKTLTPFNITAAVNTIALYNSNDEPNDKTCISLVYTKKTNYPDEKVLMEIVVKQLYWSEENCGEHFRAESMTCAEKGSYANVSQDFCQGNSGGPLVCDNFLAGLQTYINDCKPPYLYQYTPAWLKFITCGVEGKCQEKECSKLCRATDKDTPEDDIDLKLIVSTTNALVSPTSKALGSLESEEVEDTTVIRTEETISTQTLKTTLKQTETTTADNLSTNNSIPIRTTLGTTTTNTTIIEPTTETSQETTESKLYDIEIISSKSATVTEAPKVEPKETSAPVEDEKIKVHPFKSKINDARRLDESESDQAENKEKPDVEYQQESIPMADRGEKKNVCSIHSLFLTGLVLFCVI